MSKRQYIDTELVEIPKSVAKRFRDMITKAKFDTIKYELISKVRESKTMEEMDDALIVHLDFQTFANSDVEVTDATEESVESVLEPDTPTTSRPVVERVSLED